MISSWLGSEYFELAVALEVVVTSGSDVVESKRRCGVRAGLSSLPPIVVVGVVVWSVALRWSEMLVWGDGVERELFWSTMMIVGVDELELTRCASGPGGIVSILCSLAVVVVTDSSLAIEERVGEGERVASELIWWSSVS